MTDLLDAATRTAIYGPNGVFKDLQDTFFKVPVIYLKAGLAYNDSGEDQHFDGKHFTTYNLNFCTVEEQVEAENYVNPSKTGQLDSSIVRITIFVNQLIIDSSGELWDSINEAPNVKDTEDYFEVWGERFRVVEVACDGYFEQIPVLVYIGGERLYKSN